MTTRRYWLVGFFAVLLALAIIVGARSGAPSRRASEQGTTDPHAAPGPVVSNHGPTPSASVEAATPAPAAMGNAAPTLATPTGRMVFREDNDPSATESTRKIRREIWKGLEDFAKEANLTEEQWHRFLATLQESAIEFGYVLNERGNHRMDPAEFQPTSDDLGRELDERLADVLDERQLRLFKFRFHSNLLPAQLARGNILQSADAPDQKAWTPDVDGVWPAERF